MWTFHWSTEAHISFRLWRTHNCWGRLFCGQDFLQILERWFPKVLTKRTKKSHFQPPKKFKKKNNILKIRHEPFLCPNKNNKIFPHGAVPLPSFFSERLRQEVESKILEASPVGDGDPFLDPSQGIWKPVESGDFHINSGSWTYNMCVWNVNQS